VVNVKELTTLRFKLKKTVIEPSMKPNFDVVLHPNSVFIIPLLTNRLYTHEIIPSLLPVNKIPVRMGYVVRCSDTEATFKDGNTYINDIKLNIPTNDDVINLKKLYYDENTSADIISYDDIYFSLNNGDYKEPIL
jgi:hypothetical protein